MAVASGCGVAEQSELPASSNESESSLVASAALNETQSGLIDFTMYSEQDGQFTIRFDNQSANWDRDQPTPSISITEWRLSTSFSDDMINIAYSGWNGSSHVVGGKLQIDTEVAEELREKSSYTIEDAAALYGGSFVGIYTPGFTQEEQLYIIRALSESAIRAGVGNDSGFPPQSGLALSPLSLQSSGAACNLANPGDGYGEIGRSRPCAIKVWRTLGVILGGGAVGAATCLAAASTVVGTPVCVATGAAYTATVFGVVAQQRAAWLCDCEEDRTPLTEDSKCECSTELSGRTARMVEDSEGVLQCVACPNGTAWDAARNDCVCTNGGGTLASPGVSDSAGLPHGVTCSGNEVVANCAKCTYTVEIAGTGSFEASCRDPQIEAREIGTDRGPYWGPVEVTDIRFDEDYYSDQWPNGCYKGIVEAVIRHHGSASKVRSETPIESIVTVSRGNTCYAGGGCYCCFSGALINASGLQYQIFPNEPSCTP